MSMAISGTARPPAVALTGLGEQYRALKPRIDAAIQRVIERSAFIGGAELEEFEEWFAGYCGVKYAAGVSSGTTAIELSLRALGIGSGDEVVTAANSFIATAAAIAAVGARPVFADIVDSTGNLDAGQLSRVVTARTRAIVPVHLYGQPADMQEIHAVADPLRIPVVEDAAQAHGARYRGARAGSLGIAGCFSFYPTKNLGAFGDGGMVTTNHHALAASVRVLRDHGRAGKYEHVAMGCTGRLDNLQAAVLRVQAEHLDEWNRRRQEVASWYREELPRELRAIGDPRAESVYHIFAVRVEPREEFRRFLAARGVQTGIHYPVPLHLQPACKYLGYAAGDFPNAERFAREVVSLPMHPFLSRDAVRFVAQTATEFFR